MHFLPLFYLRTAKNQVTNMVQKIFVCSFFDIILTLTLLNLFNTQYTPRCEVLI